MTVPCVDVVLAVALEATLKLLGSEETDVLITFERTLRQWEKEHIPIKKPIGDVTLGLPGVRAPK